MLSFSTNAFKRTSLDDAITTLAKIGYSGVELMADMHHAHPLRLTPALRRDLHKRLDDLGLYVSNVNAFTGFACGTPDRPGDTYHPTWIEPDAKYRQLRIDHTIRCVELAAEFGCKTTSLQPAGPLIGTALSPDAASDLFAQGIAACLPAARAHHITLAIEPEPGLLIQTSQEYLTWKSRYFPNDPHIKMNCDCGHLFCTGEDPAQVIRSHPNEIAHIHLEDIAANRVHQHLTPGNGVMNFSNIFAALKDTNYDGRVTVELYPYESTAAGVAQTAYNHLRALA
jgi:sugar phosphate isomerase/epimerase